MAEIDGSADTVDTKIHEELVRALDEAKSKDAIKETFLENMNLISNTSQAKSLIGTNNNNNKGHTDTDVCNMDVTGGQEHSAKLQANLIQLLTSNISPNKKSTLMQNPEETLEKLLLTTTKNALLTEMVLNSDKPITEIMQENDKSSQSILDGEHSDGTNNDTPSNELTPKAEPMNTDYVPDTNFEADKEFSRIAPPLNGALLSCSTCPFTTDKPKTLRYHERNHRRESILNSTGSKPIKTKKIKCKKCGFSASNRLLLKKHIKEHFLQNRNGAKFSCPDCSYVTEHQTNLKRHQTSHSKGINVSCTWCDFKSTPAATTLHKYKCKVRLSQLSKHLKENPVKDMASSADDKSMLLLNGPKECQEENGKITMKCSKCPFSASNAFLLKEHIRKHLVQMQENRILSCPQCSYVTDHPPNMKRHEDTHKRCRILSCTGCDFKSTPMSLIFHQYTCKAYLSKQGRGLKEFSSSPIINNEIQYSSIIKNENFTSEMLVDDEAESKEDLLINPLELKCEVDDEAFPLDEDLNMNESYYFNSSKSKQEVIFKCAECPFYASRSLLLRKHLMTHLPEMQKTKTYPNFSCPQSSYAAVSVGNLERHQKSHEKFQNLPCPGCDFISTPKPLRCHQSTCEAYLLLHPKVEKKNDVNGMTYSKSVGLKKQMLANGSYFTCPECSFTAASVTNLVRHQKSHQRYQNFSCAGCDFMSTPKALKFHQSQCEAYLLMHPRVDKKEEINTSSNIEVKNPGDDDDDGITYKRLLSDGSKFGCPDCSYVAASATNLLRHQKSHKRYQNFSCAGCDFMSTPKCLRFHQSMCEEYLLIHPKEKSFKNVTNASSLIDVKNPDDIKVFPKKRLLTDGPNFSCPECSYAAASALNLERHQKSHKKHQNFSCTGCDFKSTPKSLKFHQYKCEAYLSKLSENSIKTECVSGDEVGEKLELPKGGYSFSCSDCSYVTICTGNLERHRKSHKRYQTFSCIGCGYTSTPKSLKFHQYKCEAYLLKQAENLTGNLSQYASMFDGNGLFYKNGSNFSCPECSYTTVCTANLIRHRKSHQRYQNVTCTGCGFKSTPKSLTFHQYTCESYLFKQSTSDLDETPSEQKKVFKCSECAFSCNLRIQLNCHVKKEHEFSEDPLNEHRTETELTVDDPTDSPDSDIMILSNFNCSLCSFSTASHAELEMHGLEHRKLDVIEENE